MEITKYFNDGCRKIDYILTYDISSDRDKDGNRKGQKREEFQSNLTQRGLELELVCT